MDTLYTFGIITPTIKLKVYTTLNPKPNSATKYAIYQPECSLFMRVLSWESICLSELGIAVVGA